MKLKLLSIYFIMLLVISCGNHAETDIQYTDNVEMIATHVSYIEAAHNDPPVAVNSTEHRILPKWNDLSDLNGTWTKLEKDKDGYLVYNPINGSTPHIVVNNNNITVYWWLEGPSEFKIQKSSISSNGKTLTFEGIMIDGPSAVFTCNLSDAAENRLNWDFTIYKNLSQGGTANYKWASTRKELESLFRYLDQKKSAPGGKEHSFASSPFE